MIELSGVTVRYNDVAPLHNITATLDAPFTSIVGPSGSGKSTLLRVLAGLQKPDAGEILLNGVRLAPRSWSTAGYARVALIHQDYRLIDFLTVEENLLLAAEMHDLSVDKEAVVAALAKVGMAEAFLDRSPQTLSGGEQQRIAIARGLVCRASVLLADEPTGALDVANTARVADVLLDLVRNGDAQVVVATHDPLVATRADVTFSLSAGQLELSE